MSRRTLKHQLVRAILPLRRRRTVHAEITENRVALRIADREWFVQSDRNIPRFQTFDFLAWMAGALSLRRGIPLRLDLPVSEGTATALARTSALWLARMPTDCHPMDLELTNIVPDPPRPDDGGILCLSGGVDSTFAAIEACKSHAYTHALLLHGMDIFYENASAFAGRYKHVARIAEHFGLELNVLRTNFPPSFRPAKSYLPMLLNCMLQYSGNGLARGGFAADNTPAYGLMIAPEANILGVETYFQSPSFGIDYFGWAATRAEKLAAIHAKSPDLLAELCVCSDDHVHGGNCGECEKCMRNRLSLQICGLDQTLMFPDSRDAVGFYETFAHSDPVLGLLGLLQTEQLAMAMPVGEDRSRLMRRASELRHQTFGHRAPDV